MLDGIRPLAIDTNTYHSGAGDRMELDLAVDAFARDSAAVKVARRRVRSTT